MGEAYRVVRPDGTIEYTDVPQGTGTITRVPPNGQFANGNRTPSEYDHQQVSTLIKEAQKRIPKLNDYFDYLSYLRHNSPIRFDRVMQELQKEDPATWMKLQKYPQFRPLKDTIVGLKAGTNILGAASGLASGKLTGSVEKWMEGTLKDLMKRDRFGPYADVLGSKATTLPTRVPSYSNSRLGQYLKTEEASAAAASSKSAGAMVQGRAAVRGAFSSTISRVGSTPLAVLNEALNPQVFTDIAIIKYNRLITQLHGKGVIAVEQAAEAQQLLSQGQYPALEKYLKQAQMDYIRGNP